MSRIKRYLLIFLSVLLIIIAWFLWRISYIANGYTAKYLCSLTFNSGLDPEQGFEEYVKPIHMLFAGVTPTVDRVNKQVNTVYLGFLRPRTAVWREGCGCTLLVESTAAELIARHHLPHRLNSKDTLIQQDALWPDGNAVQRDSLPQDIDWKAIDRILDEAMKEPSDDPALQHNTLALVVAWRGRIIGERYAKGVKPDTPLGGWSATKSITGALTGVMVKDHGFDIKQPLMLEQWLTDERKDITIDHLLRMETGLDFEEDYTPLADATAMLYASSDMGVFAAQYPPRTAPDQRWSYSSGTSNVLADVLYTKAGGTPEAMHQLAYDEFFNRLGITTAIFEHDESDAFVGSSYLSMSARDWLRVCKLYMDDGVWNSDRILPEGWVQYSLTPTPNATDACFGAHIWLNAVADPSKRRCPQLPADAFFFRGYQDQWIVGIPSKDLMLARIGVTNHEEGWSPEGMIVELLEKL
jgi:CubicO group peptidase (beta-lactamase class C family)